MKTEVTTRASRRYERIPAWTLPPLLLLWAFGLGVLFTEFVL